MKDYITVFCTVPDNTTAEKISESLVGNGLAACVNIIPGLKSIYKWENVICRSGEILLIMKSSADIFIKLKEEILKLHPYQVPEIISVKISDGHIPYLSWIDENINVNGK
jgi:periplasmic divalent cation tolerance protein